MPVQINEMIVRAHIQESPTPQHLEAKKPSENDSSRDEIIKECTEIILDILKHRDER